MRRRLSLMLAAMMLVSMVGPATATAEEPEATEEGPIYLALGSNLGAGAMKGFRATDLGYTDQLYANLRMENPDLELLDYACANETIERYYNGGFCAPGGIVGNLPAPQAELAAEAMATGRVELITIDIGNTDVIFGGVFACTDLECLSNELDLIVDGLEGIYTSLRAGAPEATIVTINFYNPWAANFAGFSDNLVPTIEGTLFVDALLAMFDQKIRAVAEPLGVLVADTHDAFQSGDYADDDGDGIPNAAEGACSYTWMCPNRDVRSDTAPNRRGYALIAATVLDVINNA